MYLVMVNKDNLPQDVILVTTDRDRATEQFLETCSERLSNWDAYTQDDKDILLDQGYELFGNNEAIVLIDTDGPTSDNEIAAELGGFPPMTVEKITRWVEAGEIGEAKTIDEVLERAGGCLDSVQSHEICGPILFQAENDKWYTGTVELVIMEAHPDYVKNSLLESDDE